MPNKSISLNSQLSDELESLLKEEDMTCPNTLEGIIDLAVQISNYKEEGKALFPEVYITDSLSAIKKSLVNADFIKIGVGERLPKVMAKALKKCAPLAFGGWCVYILRTDDSFEYGMFRAGATIISIPIYKDIIDDGDPEERIIGIRQIADKVVEVKGVKGQYLTINFGVNSVSGISILDEQKKFIQNILEKVDPKIKDQMTIFFARLFLYVTQNGHGHLCTVIDYKKAYPKFLTDGILLDQEISVSETIRQLSTTIETSNTLEINSKLNGTFNLIAGMMMSDGITVFTDNGTVKAYNVFIKHPKKDTEDVSGGARSRTFAVLGGRLSSIIKSIYIQSQDGKTETRKYE
ncbi:hypothetical protein [Pedobacter suwonensis]|uniref:hypothetical protein n=1 Tax=Pedobacter suwonensis TaxID=332999 RepID=UPI00368A3A61